MTDSLISPSKCFIDSNVCLYALKSSVELVSRQFRID